MADLQGFNRGTSPEQVPTNTSDVLRAQFVIDAAKQQEKAEQHAARKRQLIEVRKQLRESRVRYNGLVAAQKTEVAEHAKLRAQIDNIDILIDQSLQVRPAAADVLSAADDLEIATWTRQHEKLTRARETLLDRRAAVPVTDLIERARLANGIAQLEHQERNLIALLADTLAQKDTGSVRPLR